MSRPIARTDLQAIEARLAARFSAVLSRQAEQTPHDIAERLRVAREQAVARAGEARRQAPRARAASEVSVVGVTSQGVALMGGSAPWWQRAASLLPLLVLIFGLLLVQRQTELEQVHAAAEIDSQLLADDLPPAAYTDPGFAQFLREPTP